MEKINGSKPYHSPFIKDEFSDPNFRIYLGCK